MKGFPDVLGSKLSDAAAILQEREIDYSVTETTARKKAPVCGELRVIRQTEKDGRLFLTVCKVPEVQGKGVDDDDKEKS